MAHADRNSAHMKGPLDYEEILLVLKGFWMQGLIYYTIHYT